MIVITGAAGFIGSALAHYLSGQFYTDLVLVDEFSREDKLRNIHHLKVTEKVPRENFGEWLDRNHRLVQFVFHLGARTDTAEFDKRVFNKLNLNYSKMVWNKCVLYGLPLIYASSAATYGMGEFGYADDHEVVAKLKPLNPYGESKNEFDKWVLQQEEKPWFWAGMKFFNVYGPNEYHKGRMASVVFHAFRQVSQTGRLKLFRSHRSDFKDGEQMRDFVYVKDVVKVLFFLMLHRKDSGIYNLGTGKARTFMHLGEAVFYAMSKPVQIDFVDTPEDIRDKYQYFTEAKMDKLRSIGYVDDFYTLEKGITDYIQNYLIPGRYMGE